MQVSTADSFCCKRVGVEEKLINFISSPNLKNMKKFIISKNRAMNEALESPTQNMDKIEQKIEVQPPLPLDPPPPDEVLPLNVQVKPDIDDPNYMQTTEEDNLKDKTLENSELNENLLEKKPEVCRDYIRGNCKRMGTCRFLHKYDVSQLFGVYTFCRNFQTAVCTLPVCKYVHATVFEEHHFYRTGYLPPHAFAHHKKNLLPPPPPPPPEEPQINFPNPPPPLQVPVLSPPRSIINCIPASNLKPREPPNPVEQRSSPPLKRDWSTSQQFPSGLNEVDSNENVQKKCKTCDDSEIRLQYHKLKVENMRQATEELTKKISQLDKKSETLNNLILVLIKPVVSKSPNPLSSNSENKDKWLWEQLNTSMNFNSRLAEDK